LALAAALPARAPAQPHNAAREPIVMCTGQAVPEGYVVIATGRGQQCPRFYDGYGPNTYTVVLPQETVTVCSALNRPLDGYLVTARGRAQECPGFYDGYGPNTTTYQRAGRGRWGRGGPPRDEPGDAPADLAPLEPGDRSLLHRLRAAEARMQVDEPTHRTWTGTLRQGATATARLDLQPGESYAVLAACDRDCNDADLRVDVPSDAGNRVLAQDVGPEPVATVRVPSTAPPRLVVTVTMAQCAADECGFAVAVHRAPAPVAAPVPGSPRPGAPRPVPPTTPRP
ncbi:MAG TPA: hypothetical protein VFH27_06460, partial [Longimicrobiaceae bacterium]|nr:hypothetical protein [Longimicrobiaceae bacterium]